MSGKIDPSSASLDDYIKQNRSQFRRGGARGGAVRGGKRGKVGVKVVRGRGTLSISMFRQI